MIKNEANKTTLAPAFYTIAQTRVIMNVSEKTVRRLIARGIFECPKAIRKKLIPRKQVENLL